MALWLLPKRRFLCVGAKANVPLCGGKKMNKKCAVGKKKKYTRVSKECRLTRCPVSIWSVFVCLSVKMVYFSCPSVRYCQVARSSVTLAANVLRIGEVPPIFFIEPKRSGGKYIKKGAFCQCAVMRSLGGGSLP